MSAFNINHEELFKLLNMMKPFVKMYTKKNAMNIILEVSFENGTVYMSIPNCTMNGVCVTTGNGKFNIKYLYFYDIIKTSKDKTITISSSDNKITVGQTIFKALI